MNKSFAFLALFLGLTLAQISFAGKINKKKPLPDVPDGDFLNEENFDEKMDEDASIAPEKLDSEADRDEKELDWDEEEANWNGDDEIISYDDIPAAESSHYEVDLDDEGIDEENTPQDASSYKDNSDGNEFSENPASESKKPGSVRGKNSEVRVVKTDQYPSLSCVLFGKRACNMSCDIVAEMFSFTSEGVCDSADICNCHNRNESKNSKPPAIKFTIEGGYDKTDMKNYIIEKVNEEQKALPDESLLDVKYKEKFTKALENSKGDKDLLYYYTFKVADLKNKKLENILDEFFKAENIEKPQISFPKNRLEIIHRLVSDMIVNELIDETESASV